MMVKRWAERSARTPELDITSVSSAPCLDAMPTWGTPTRSGRSGRDPPRTERPERTPAGRAQEWTTCRLQPRHDNAPAFMRPGARHFGPSSQLAASPTASLLRAGRFRRWRLREARQRRPRPLHKKEPRAPRSMRAVTAPAGTNSIAASAPCWPGRRDCPKVGPIGKTSGGGSRADVRCASRHGDAMSVPLNGEMARCLCVV